MGSPVVLDVQKDDHYTGTKALWSTNFADVVIEGDELQNNIGMTTREIMEGASLTGHPSEPQPGCRVVLNSEREYAWRGDEPAESFVGRAVRSTGWRTVRDKRVRGAADDSGSDGGASRLGT